MKLLRSQKKGPGPHPLTFQLSLHEKQWFITTLSLYPLLDDTYHKITKTNRADIKASQKFLQESMSDQRRAYRKKLDQFLHPKDLFQPDASGQYRFTITAEQADWLLQILNDIRVGSWIKLGSPDLDKVRQQGVTQEKTRYLLAMEMSGFFQMVLLEALHHTS